MVKDWQYDYGLDEMRRHAVDGAAAAPNESPAFQRFISPPVTLCASRS